MGPRACTRVVYGVTAAPIPHDEQTRRRCPASVQLPVVTAWSAATGRDSTSTCWSCPVFDTDRLRGCAWPGRWRSDGERRLPRATAAQFTGKPFELLVLSAAGRTGWQARRVALRGAGAAAGRVTADVLRRVAITGGLAARQQRVRRVAVLVTARHQGAAAGGGAGRRRRVTTANYDGASLQDRRPRPRLARGGRGRAPRAGGLRPDGPAVARGVILGECTNQARDARQRAGQSPDAARVRRARRRARRRPPASRWTFSTRRASRQLNMGLLLGVARGSQEPPRLLVLRHEPAGAVSGVTLGLVGKGITFDTGGISIKPAREHGQDEGRHVRRRGGDRRHGGHRPARCADPLSSASCR